MKIKESTFKALRFLALCLLVMYLMFGYRYRVTYNLGESMYPTFKNGEWIYIQKRGNLPPCWAPAKFDIIVVGWGGDNLIKRVIGVAGDTIEIKEGLIYLNEKKLQDPFGKGEIGLYLVDENDNNLKYWNGPGGGEDVVELTNQNKEKIPEGFAWVIGDNRNLSWYGMVEIKNIKGLVIF